MAEHIYPVEHELIDRLGSWVKDRTDLGITWRLEVGHDGISILDHVNECEAYGRMVWTRNSVDTGWSTRPRVPYNFHARVVNRDRNQTLWWYPTPDVWGCDEPYTQEDAARDFNVIRRMWDDGIAAAILTRRTVCPCCEQAIDRQAALGGIDVWPSDDEVYWRTIASDLMAEVGES